MSAFSTSNGIQINRTFIHSNISSCKEVEKSSTSFSFVVAADTQFGIWSMSKEWDTEMEYSIRAVNYINSLSPRPLFVSMCGDLADMEPVMFEGTCGTKEECIEIQNKQYDDFKRIWSQLNSEIPLLCLCGNHDVGNVPTVNSIDRFTTRFGDDYFSFWCRDIYIVCLNTNLYSDHSLAEGLFEAQHAWLESRLAYARQENARRIFIFGHHPWFLDNELETEADTTGTNSIPGKPGEVIPDSYFHIKLPERTMVMSLCREYHVDACFAGHYHQNLVTESTWGMPMIITGALCNWNLESTAKEKSKPDNKTPGAGVRIVVVNDEEEKGFSHHYDLV